MKLQNLFEQKFAKIVAVRMQKPSERR
jgi:hypothetical protein